LGVGEVGELEVEGDRVEEKTVKECKVDREVVVTS